ncbi:MAG: hypothetical protein WBV61_13740 [Rhodanobacteraceae bacterium]
MNDDTTAAPPESELRNWLLHRLSETGAQAFEQRVLIEDEFASRVEEAEYDLVDDYANDRLDDSDRSAVENYLLATAASRERLWSARALAQLRAAGQKSLPDLTQSVAKRDARKASRFARASRTPQSQRDSRHRWRRHVAAFGAIAALAVVVLVLGVRVERDRMGAPAMISLAAPSSDIVNLTLLASTERGADQTRRLTIPRTATAIRLQLEIERPAAQARYQLTVADGNRIVFAAHNLKVRQAGPYAFVEAMAPAHLLAPGIRRISLAQQGGEQALAQWTVRLARSD